MKKMIRGVVWGAFEYLHIGHIRLFQNAKRMCDELVVAISGDDWIEETKGHRPQFDYVERARAVASIREVDYITIQSKSFRKSDVVELYKPDIIFVGNDWTPETFTGEGLGVKIIYLPRTENISSTKIRCSNSVK